MDDTVLSVLVFCACVIVGHQVAGWLFKKPNRRKLMCKLGQHKPDTIRDEGDFYVARCFHCDRVVMRMANNNQIIRRVK